MTTAGWDFYKNEWWHYQLYNSKEWPLISDQEAQTNIMY
jgi:D-alanyl-D-alanine dipeptidase